MSVVRPTRGHRPDGGEPPACRTGGARAGRHRPGRAGRVHPLDALRTRRPRPHLRPLRARRLGRAGAVGVLTAAAVGTTVAVPRLGQEAGAAAVSARALHVAAAKRGAPYHYGSAGPYRFDCSGLVLYSYRKAGRWLPRTAQQQYAHTRHIAPSRRRPGDLVFFHDGRTVYHVGIYAGRGRIWNAPHTGARVRLDRIRTGSVWYGRVG